MMQTNSFEDAGFSLPTPEEIRTDVEVAKRGGNLSSAHNQDVKQSFFKYYVCGFIVILILLTGLLVGLGEAENELENPSPHRETISQRFVHVSDLLRDNQIVEDPSVLDDNESPQYKAVLWLVNNDGWPMDKAFPLPPTARTSVDRIATGADEDVTETEQTYNEAEWQQFLQRYALATIFYAMGGREWKYRLNFLTYKHVCHWDHYFILGGRGTMVGVTCHTDGSNLIRELRIFGNEAIGSLPHELGLLNTLVELEIYSNEDITGPLPDNMSQLTDLEILAMPHNSLTGTIPEWIGDLSMLKVLSLGHNQLVGSLPNGMSNLKLLTELFLDENMLTGDLESLQGMSSARNLYLENNSFSGKLGSIFSNDNDVMNKLQELDLSGNQISGELPIDLLGLRLLDLSNNGLQGPFPTVPELTVVAGLEIEFLALYDNAMTGSLPADTLNGLAYLTHLDLAGNQFNGQIPALTLTDLTYLFLSDNVFDLGGIPSSWMTELTNLRELSLRNVNLANTIPDTLGSSLTDLVLLDLSDNDLTGSIPDSLGDLDRLSFLLLNDNKLTGSIPNSFANLEHLVLLHLQNNDFTGNSEPICQDFETTHPNLEDFSNGCSTGLSGDSNASDNSCPCCTRCCEKDSNDNVICGLDGQQLTTDEITLGNYQPMWELNYERAGRQFVFGDNLILTAAADPAPSSDGNN